MRRLPVYFLIDVSDSMAGEPIAEVEKGMHGIIRELRSDPYALETVFVSVLVFAGKAERLSPLTELIQFNMPALPIGSGTNLGMGLDLLMADMKREVQKTTSEQKGDWKPLIFLFTDGAPTDNPDKAISQWNRDFRSHCNLVIITFGDNSDINLLEKLSENVLTLKDTSPEAFREFFKWVSASIQVSSVAVMEKGENGTNLPPGINLEKGRQPDSTDENFAILHLRCSHTKKDWLAKYERQTPGKNSIYSLVGSYPIDEKAYDRLRDTSAAQNKIDTAQLRGFPKCPCCEQSDGFALCGNCGGMFCAGGEKNFTCPWCGNTGTLNYSDSFDINRTHG